MPVHARARNRAAQDATLINLRAAKARIAKLEKELHTLKQRFDHIENAFFELFSGIEAAQKAAKGEDPTR